MMLRVGVSGGEWRAKKGDLAIFLCDSHHKNLHYCDEGHIITAAELTIGNKPNWSRNKMKFRNFTKKILASYLNTVKNVPPGAMM